MAKRLTPYLFTGLLVLGLGACSSDDDAPAAEAGDSSQFNPDLENGPAPGTPGGDTTAIAGLWNGSFDENDGTNTLYWSMAENGVLTSYDYQQDQGQNATGENCYIAGDAITVTPGTGDNYSIAGTSTTITSTAEALTVVFLEADKSDLDEDGDTAEMPTYTWPAVAGLTVSGLPACSDG